MTTWKVKQMAATEALKRGDYDAAARFIEQAVVMDLRPSPCRKAPWTRDAS